jgi:hypothetical protein
MEMEEGRGLWGPLATVLCRSTWIFRTSSETNVHNLFLIANWLLWRKCQMVGAGKKFPFVFMSTYSVKHVMCFTRFHLSSVGLFFSPFFSKFFWGLRVEGCKANEKWKRQREAKKEWGTKISKSFVLILLASFHLVEHHMKLHLRVSIHVDCGGEESQLRGWKNCF